MSWQDEQKKVATGVYQKIDSVYLTGEIIVAAAQSCLSPHQYDHFESLLEGDPDAHNRLARAIEAKLKKKNGYGIISDMKQEPVAKTEK